MIMVILIEQVQFLLPVGIVVGVITIQDNHSRFPIIRFNKSIHQLLPNTIQILAFNRVLQTAHRRLGSKRQARLWQATCTGLENHVISKIIAVVTIFITRSYLKNSLSKHLSDRMINISLIPVICNTVTYAID